MSSRSHPAPAAASAGGGNPFPALSGLDQCPATPPTPTSLATVGSATASADASAAAHEAAAAAAAAAAIERTLRFVSSRPPDSPPCLCSDITPDVHRIPPTIPLRILQVLKSRPDWFVIQDVHVTPQQGNSKGKKQNDSRRRSHGAR